MALKNLYSVTILFYTITNVCVFPHETVLLYAACFVPVYLVIVRGGTLCCSKGVSVGPVPVSIQQRSIVALLAGPAIAHCTPSVDAVLMDARHQRPATSGSGHVTESLIDHAISSGQVIQSIWKYYSKSCCMPKYLFKTWMMGLQATH